MTIDFEVPVGRVVPPDWIRPVGGGGRAMLDHLLRSGEAAQAALPARLDLSQPSVARLVGSFVAEGLIAAAPRVASGRGNPSVLLRLVPDYAYALGVGITGDLLSMALVDFTGRVRTVERAAMIDRSRAAVVVRLAAMRDSVLAAAAIDQARIVGTGVGFSGFFVGTPPRFNPPALLDDWVDADLPQVLEPAFGTNVLCDNDATCAAVAEALLGVGRSTPTFAYCHLTNGFGGGLIVDGRPMRGALGNAGDFGAIWWYLGRGYPGLDRLRMLVAGETDRFVTVEDMLPVLAADTPGVAQWLEEAREPFTTLAFLLGHMVAPTKVVIGGRAPGWLAQALAASIRLPATPTRHDRPFPLPAVVAREVEGDAVAIGAALMPLRDLFFR